MKAAGRAERAGTASLKERPRSSGAVSVYAPLSLPGRRGNLLSAAMVSSATIRAEEQAMEEEIVVTLGMMPVVAIAWAVTTRWSI